MERFHDWILEVDMIDVIMNSILMLVVIAIWLSVYRAHKANGSSRYNKFNLIDLITTREGTIDRPAFMEVTAFIVMTWGFIYLTGSGKLTEWYAGIYIGAFVLRAAHSAFLKCRDHGPHPLAGGGEMKSTITKTETVTPATPPGHVDPDMETGTPRAPYKP